MYQQQQAQNPNAGAQQGAQGADNAGAGASDNVYDADFKINPININNGKEDGCAYCSFRDVCYRKPTQINRITTVVKEGDKDE